MSEFTFDNMKTFLTIGWGERGARTAERWLEFNRLYFGGELLPIPLFFTNTTPFGKRLAHCCGNAEVRHIALNMPSTTGHGHYELVADANTLLHEMVHQRCNQCGVSANHKDAPWREEIMRLHHQITGEHIFAGRQKVIKVKGEDGKRKSVRIQDDDGANGLPPLGQAQIARWPHDIGIELGPL